MPVYRYPKILSSEITPEDVWRERRQWMKAAGAVMATAPLGMGAALAATPSSTASLPALPGQKSRFVLMEPSTPEKDVVSYNNFYEFGLDKSDPA